MQDCFGGHSAAFAALFSKISHRRISVWTEKGKLFMTKMVSVICVVLVCLLCLLPAGFSAAWPGPNGNTAICSIPGVTVVFSPLSGDVKQYWSEKLRGSLKDFANDAFLHDCVAQGLIPPDADPSVYSCISAPLFRSTDMRKEWGNCLRRILLNPNCIKVME